MTYDELSRLFAQLGIDIDPKPTLIYVFYVTPDGLVNNFSISERRARNASGQHLTDAQVVALFEHMPAAHNAKVLAVERPGKQPVEWLDAADVCRLLGISRQTLRRWMAQGVLQAARVGKRYYFEREAVDAFVRSNMMQENGRLDKSALELCNPDVD